MLIQISLFHRAFFNSIMYKTPTHALFCSTLYYNIVLNKKVHVLVFYTLLHVDTLYEKGLQ